MNFFSTYFKKNGGTEDQIYFRHLDEDEGEAEDEGKGKKTSCLTALIQPFTKCLNSLCPRGMTKWIITHPQISLPLTLCLLSGSLVGLGGIICLASLRSTQTPFNSTTPNNTPFNSTTPNNTPFNSTTPNNTPFNSTTCNPKMPEKLIYSPCNDTLYSTILVNVPNNVTQHKDNVFHIVTGKYYSHNTTLNETTIFSVYSRGRFTYDGNNLKQDMKNKFPEHGGNCFIRYKQLKNGTYTLEHTFNDNSTSNSTGYGNQVTEVYPFLVPSNSTCKLLDLNKQTLTTILELPEGFSEHTQDCLGYSQNDNINSFLKT